MLSSRHDSADGSIPDNTAQHLGRSLWQRMNVLRWLIPIGLLAVVVVFQLGPARWIEVQFGANAHFLTEVVVYGSIGPALAFLSLNIITRWMEEQQTSDLQARILAQARERSAANHQLNDDVLQGLFAVSVLLAASKTPNMPDPAAQRLVEAERALDLVIRQLREHLLTHPSRPA